MEHVRLRRAAAPSSRSAGTRKDPVQLGHRHLDLHRDVRAGAVADAGRAEVRRRRLGARDRPDAADRQGRGRHRHVAARAGPRDRVEPDRRRRARRRPDDVKVIHGDTASSPYGMDTYGSRSLVVGGIAVVAGRREGGREGPGARRAHARGRPGRPRVRATARSGSRARRARRRRSRRWRSRPFTAHDLPEGVEPTLHADATIDPRPSRSRTAPTCARSRSTPRPAWPRSASTSASTTSARWSTR